MCTSIEIGSSCKNRVEGARITYICVPFPRCVDISCSELGRRRFHAHLHMCVSRHSSRVAQTHDSVAKVAIGKAPKCRHTRLHPHWQPRDQCYYHALHPLGQPRELLPARPHAELLLMVGVERRAGARGGNHGLHLVRVRVRVRAQARARVRVRVRVRPRPAPPPTARCASRGATLLRWRWRPPRSRPRPRLR